jgi:hypothetical protein
LIEAGGISSTGGRRRGYPSSPPQLLLAGFLEQAAVEEEPIVPGNGSHTTVVGLAIFRAIGTGVKPELAGQHIESTEHRKWVETEDERIALAVQQAEEPAVQLHSTEAATEAAEAVDA